VTLRLGDVTRAAAALIAVLALLAAAKELPNSLDVTDSLVEQNAGLSPLDRELAATRAFALDPALLLRADERLPRDAVFYVTTGSALASGHEAAAPFSAYWLLPRRHTDDPRQADWILSFGADRAQLGVPTEVVEDLGGRMQLLRVRR
jgi:hypothetical protein